MNRIPLWIDVCPVQFTRSIHPFDPPMVAPEPADAYKTTEPSRPLNIIHSPAVVARKARGTRPQDDDLELQPRYSEGSAEHVPCLMFPPCVL
jgi:hypothetical protein